MQKTFEAGRSRAGCVSDAGRGAGVATGLKARAAAKPGRRLLSGASRLAVAGWACLGLGQAALAQVAEQISYQYDALGRLRNVAHSGTVNNGVTAAYTLDAAGNRTNLTVTTGAHAAVIADEPARPEQSAAAARAVPPADPGARTAVTLPVHAR